MAAGAGGRVGHGSAGGQGAGANILGLRATWRRLASAHHVISLRAHKVVTSWIHVHMNETRERGKGSRTRTHSHKHIIQTHKRFKEHYLLGQN